MGRIVRLLQAPTAQVVGRISHKLPVFFARKQLDTGVTEYEHGVRRDNFTIIF
jgi:hypothetical protein